jgi:uncharacterized damage-inducible protein DinB
MTVSSTAAPYTEPWLRGTHTDVPPSARAVIHALELAGDDARRWTEGLSDLEIQAQPFGLMSAATQLRHIAGSTDRLLTYAGGGQLSDEQLSAMKKELAGSETLEQLLAELDAALGRAADRVRALANDDWNSPRKVGRKLLPTTLGGTLIHVADHAQRHIGQLVTTAKVLKAMRSSGTS